MSLYKLEAEPAEEVPRGPCRPWLLSKERCGWLICGKLPRWMEFPSDKPCGGGLVSSVVLPLLLMCGWKKGPEGHKSVEGWAGLGYLTGPLWGGTALRPGWAVACGSPVQMGPCWEIRA